MQRMFLAILTLVVVACGGSESPKTTAATGGETATATTGSAADAPAVPPVSAPAPTAPAAPAAPSGESAVAAEDPKSQECLELVAKASFEAAIPVCAAALATNADDPRIAQALATAKSQSSGALVDQATGAATGAANDAAKSQLEGMTGGALGNATE